jgi:metal-responsive CopG/Arc/MetJ family transcriptional regulator
MRTTVSLDDDVAATVDRLRREQGMGLSEVVNQLARAGMIAKPETAPFRQRTSRLGLRIDVSDVAEAIELLEGPTSR